MKTTKAILIALASVLLCVLLGVGIFAADETVVYVGSDTDAYSTLESAVDALGGKGGTVIIKESYSQTTALTLPEQSGDLTIRSEAGGALVLSSTLTLAKNTNSNTITFDLPVTATDAVIFGGFNSVTFGENFAVTGTLDFFGGADSPAGSSEFTAAKDTYLIENLKNITELPYTITVNAGTFRKFTGGNRRTDTYAIMGSIAAPINIVINGGTFGTAVSFSANDLAKPEDAISISGMSYLADDATLTINGGTFNAPVYAVGRAGNIHTRAGACSVVVRSDRKYYAIDGDITMNINGGTFNCDEISPYQVTAGTTSLLRGNFTLNIGADAVLGSGIVCDATQCKPYAGSNATATLNYAAGLRVTAKRFDIVNGAAQSYTEPLRIACVGDSITQGTGSANHEIESYPSRLLELIADNGKEAVIGNYGMGGSTVMNYGSIWYNDMLTFAIATEECDADWFVVGLGTNDAYNAARSLGQQYHFKNDYRNFVTTFGNLPETDKVFMTNPIWRNTSTKLADISAVCLIGDIQEEVAAELGQTESGKYIYVDLYALTLDGALSGSMMASDNLHPSAAGYKNYYAPAIYGALFEGVLGVENFKSDNVYVSATGRANGAGTAQDPTSSLTVAMAKLAPTSTLHIVGTISYAARIYTPRSVTSLTVVGEGDGAMLQSNATYGFVWIGGDTVFDNIKLAAADGKYFYIVAGYNDLELSSTVTTASATLIAGAVTYSDDISDVFYTPVESINSDSDCTITLNGGRFIRILGGDFRWSNSAPIGTYSGNLVLNIGSGATVVNNTRGGICGENYLAGTITANIDTWPANAAIREFAPYIGLDGVVFDEMRNTGTVTIKLADGMTNAVKRAGDFNDDGNVDIVDALMLIKYMLGNFDSTKVENFYGQKSATLANVLHALKKLSA